MTPTWAVTSEVNALDGCSNHHLQGAGHIVAAQRVICDVVTVAITSIISTSSYRWTGGDPADLLVIQSLDTRTCE